MKENLLPNEFIVICDFAENYSFTVQDEIQAFHWANKQCTIHPFCIYFKNESGELKNLTFVIIAESLCHNYVAVYLFQKKLLEFLKARFNTITKLIFFSDGAASQYKNRIFFYNLCEMQNESMRVEWHFFATYHGKGPCDAVGGTLKRLATKASLQRLYTNHILTAKDLFDWTKSHVSTINTAFVTEEEHDAFEKKIKNRYNNVKTIRGTQSFHCFLPVDKTSINVKRYSFAEKVTNVKLL